MHRQEIRDFAKAIMGLAIFLGIGVVIFALTGCASMAHLIGVETVGDTDEKVKAVHAALDLFGPWGSLVATGVSAVLVGANHAYRNKTRAKALAASSGPTIHHESAAVKNPA